MIPYTLERRGDTGVNNSTLGIWLFLASEVMLFGALFSAYTLLRVSAPAWPVGRTVLSLPLGSVNTAILLAMSVVAWRARSLEARSARTALGISTALAVAFLAVKAVEYRGEFAAGMLPSVSTFLAMYFTLTGLHALHVVCGIVANLWAMTGLSRVGEPMTVARIRALSLYWAFVDVVWLLIFTLLYLS
jgi:heme/copper-type cytochrome/quinol oxidase subunit 3